MLTSITRIPIFRRLFYAFLLAAVIPGIVISILGATFISTQSHRSQAVQTNIGFARASSDTGADLPRLNDLLAIAGKQYQAGGHQFQAQTQDIIADIHTLQNTFDSRFQQYKQSYQIATAPAMNSIRNILASDDPNSTLASRQQKILQQVTTLWPAYKDAQEQTIKAIDGNASSARITTLLKQANTRYTSLKAFWDQIIQISQEVSQSIAIVGPSQTNPIVLATIIAFLSTIMVVITIGYIVNLTITRPLQQLATLTKRIAKGETSARVRIIGHDEIYMVATSMNNMLDNIVRLIQETQAQRDVLQGQVEKLVSEVSGVGEGDLRLQAEVTADALGVLADSFNYMVEELSSLIVRVKMVANEVEGSTSSILDRMTQLVEVADTQIEQIGEAAIEVEEMAGLSQQVADRSNLLSEVARNARQDTQIGRESVAQAIQGMGRINENVQTTADKVQTLGERSREINEIVEVISSIAHQTNRLALDAAIQAAMAGENGKGFGAVAADIRRLAERAKDQTSMITRIVRSVREEIGAVAISMQDTQRETYGGTRLTQEAAVALESIFAAVEHQAREIESINKMAVQQLQSSSAVVHIMHGVSDSTQESSMITRDASQEMERLARLVEQLRSSVEAFKLRDNQHHLTPKNGAIALMDEEQDGPLTVSAVLRTVSATAQPSAQMPSLLPPNLPKASPFSFYPLASAQANNRRMWSFDNEQSALEDQTSPFKG